MGSLLNFSGRKHALECTYITFTSPGSLPPTRLMAVILVWNIQ